MTPSPRVLMTSVALLSLALGAVLVLAARLWQRARHAASPGLDARLEDLERRLVALEARPAPDASARSEPSEARRTEARRHPGPPPIRPAAPVVRVDPPEPAGVAGPTLIAVPSLAAPAASSSSTPEAPLDLDRRFGGICDLADEGLAPLAIAERTGQPIGQVELILALRRQMAAGPRSRS